MHDWKLLYDSIFELKCDRSTIYGYMLLCLMEYKSFRPQVDAIQVVTDFVKPFHAFVFVWNVSFGFDKFEACMH
jgi:hypothetical protein